MPRATHALIESVTLTSNASAISINIPQIYSHLEIITGIIGTGGLQNNFIRFNSDTNSNYGFMRFSGHGSSASASQNGSFSYIPLDFYGNSWSGGVIGHVVKVYDYKNTSYFKQISANSSELLGSTNGVDVISGTWRSNSAITNITIAPTGNQFAVGTTISVYGIKEE
jgi:hypothetical protein